jgi:hypothetical protein
MSTFIVSITCISITILILLLISIREDWSDSVAGCTIILVLIGIFGYGVAACCMVRRIEYKIASVSEIIKGRKICMICTDTKNSEFDGYPIEKINDSTKFYWKVEYNQYNLENDRILSFYNNKDSTYIEEKH